MEDFMRKFLVVLLVLCGSLQAQRPFYALLLHDSSTLSEYHHNDVKKVESFLKNFCKHANLKLNITKKNVSNIDLSNIVEWQHSAKESQKYFFVYYSGKRGSRYGFDSFTSAVLKDGNCITANGISNLLLFPDRANFATVLFDCYDSPLHIKVNFKMPKIHQSINHHRGAKNLLCKHHDAVSISTELSGCSYGIKCGSFKGGLLTHVFLKELSEAKNKASWRSATKNIKEKCKNIKYNKTLIKVKQKIVCDTSATMAPDSIWRVK